MILDKIFLIFEDLSLDNSYKTNSYKKVCIGLFVFAQHAQVKTHNITENAEEVSQENVYPLLHDLQDNGKENLL